MNVMNSIKRIVKATLKALQPQTIIQAKISQLAPNEMLKGRVALITGGTSGIGFEIAKAFLNAKASVVITGRSDDKLKKAVNELSPYGPCCGLVMDITNTDTIQAKFAEAVTKYGKIDILVNNAGVSGCYLINGVPEEFDKVIDTNLKGVFFLSQEVGRYMKENQIHGNILNISSASSVRPAACAYTISKWGIRGFTLGLARTLLPYGITVNALAPGPVATPLLNKEGKNDNLSLPNTPYGRYAIPEEVANMAVILVSPIARLVIGDTVFMTGGAGNVNNGDIPYPF